MKLCQVLMLFLVPWNGRPGLSRAKTYSAAEGENITVKCLFYFSGNTKLFCKNDCKKADILVETSDNRHQKGRYSIEYEEYSSSPRNMSVSITNVSRSDSGRYRCALENWSGSVLTDDESVDFMIDITNGLTPRPAVTVTQRSVPSSPPKHQLNHTTSLSETLLYVGLTLAAAVVLLSVTFFILCRKKRANKEKEPAEASENPHTLESNCLYEEIPNEISQSRPRPVEISTVYVTASFSNQSRLLTSTVWPQSPADNSSLKTS